MSCTNMWIYGILTNCKEFFNRKHQEEENVTLFYMRYPTIYFNYKD